MPAAPNQQLHIAVCDDESIDRQQTADLTRGIMAAEGLACDLSGYESAAALLAAIQGGAQFAVQNHIQHLISALDHRADFFILSNQPVQICRRRAS